MTKLFSALPKPLNGIIGHRGAAGLAPENTLQAFQKAYELGLNWIEFDIQLCQDGQWIVFHDQFLNRTSNGSGLVSSTPLSIIQQLDVGSWFSTIYASTRIPLLSEALNFAKNFHLHPNIEIKTFVSEQEIKRIQLEDLFISIRTAWPKGLPSPLLSSFDLETLVILRSLSSKLPLGYNIEEDFEGSMKAALQHQFDSLHVPAALATEQNLKLAIQNQLPLLVYTVNDPSEIQHFLSIGATAVFSDLTSYY